MSQAMELIERATGTRERGPQPSSCSRFDSSPRDLRIADVYLSQNLTAWTSSRFAYSSALDMDTEEKRAWGVERQFANLTHLFLARLAERRQEMFSTDTGERGYSTRKVTWPHGFGKVAPRIVQWTTDVLLREFWLYSYVATRDRSPVTLSALIACAKDSQIPYYLSRAMDNGLTQGPGSRGDHALPIL